MPFDYKKFLQYTPESAGVYCMYDIDNQVIYVGKAKNLKNRLSSYFQKTLFNVKTQALVQNIHNIEIIVTNNELEALLLENNYIKRYKPKYNILLRDDKSYPYILLTNDKYPSLITHRGNKNLKGEYFGPYPSMTDVKETLKLLQKIFPIRQGSQKVYRRDNRPYLQYQIGYCLDPTLSATTTDADYAEQVQYVRLFLQGKDQQVLQYLIDKMNKASHNLEFELAGKIRDQIKSVRHMMEKQFVSKDSNQNVDVIAFSYKLGIACINILFIRQGKIFGSKNYYPKVPENTDFNELVNSFIEQFYIENKATNIMPNLIILEQGLENQKILEELLSAKANKKIQIYLSKKGIYAKYMQLAKNNAEHHLNINIKRNLQIKIQFKQLSELLNIKTIKRMECFDVSHTMGKQTVASCVTFNDEGPLYNDYRIFNIDNIQAGDDYAAMEQAILKRYNKPLATDKIPDILFIDGGKGQLQRAINTFKKMQTTYSKEKILLIGVAKGTDRKAGLETLFINNVTNAVHLPDNSPALHLIQYIRDESHNYAVNQHRKKRQKAFKNNEVTNIPGIGSKRKQILIQYLGGMQELKSASIDELTSIPTISPKLAQKIFEYFKK